MRFNWQKKGLIFRPNNLYDWMAGYTSPITCVLLEHAIRVYFSTRPKMDANGFFKTYISFVDVDINCPSKIVYMHDKPVLELGKPGTFDEHGTMVAEVFKHGNEFFMYYMGWQRSATVPYVIRLGLAKCFDGINFKKYSDGPVIGLSTKLPFGIGNVSVLFEDNKFRMWYTHFKEWYKGQKGYRPDYDLRYAESLDGVNWNLLDTSVKSHNNESLATPCVRKFDDKYIMFYSYREGVLEDGSSGHYMIGNALSKDGKHWIRNDKNIGIGLSAEGWDSEMICYPDLVEVNNKLLLFYCGNGYGETGFGYAILNEKL